MSINTVMDQLKGVPVQSGIDVADFLKGAVPSKGIGNLNPTQVQGLLAQAKASANQAITTVSATTGIGSYGMSPQQLEQAGFLKPGTVSTYLKDPKQLEAVLRSPAVWTGKDGVASLTGFLSSADKQAAALQSAMASSFNALSKLGTLPAGANVADVGSLLQVASKFGVDAAVGFANGKPDPGLVNQITQIAKSGQFAVNFTDVKLPPTLKGEVVGRTFTDRVNRTEVDSAVKNILGSDKIPAPNYKNPPPRQTPKVTAADYSAAVNAANQARLRYTEILEANNNNRSAPAVQQAFEELRAALRRAEEIERELGPFA